MFPCSIIKCGRQLQVLCFFHRGKIYQCEICDENFLLIANICNEIKAQNCLEYDDHNSCKTCPLKRGLKVDALSGFKNCEIIDIDNCLISSTEAPFQCDTCSRGYFVSENLCQMAPQNIENCKYLQVVFSNLIIFRLKRLARNVMRIIL